MSYMKPEVLFFNMIDLFFNHSLFTFINTCIYTFNTYVHTYIFMHIFYYSSIFAVSPEGKLLPFASAFKRRLLSGNS